MDDLDDASLGGHRDDMIDGVEIDQPGVSLGHPLKAEDDGGFDDFF